MPLQDEFHRSSNRIRLLIGGNRSGKSVASFVEDARAALNMDPYKKYPKKGTLVLLGYDLRHVGLVVYPMLFRPGAFKIIKEADGTWTTFNPSNPEHWERRRQARLAPPIIPARFVQDIAWEDKAKQEFVRIDLITGWTILAFGSRGEPQQGFQADVVHIDEDIQRDDWFTELLMRVVDRSGYLYWTAMPQSKTYSLRRLCEMADGEETAQIPEEARDIKKIVLTTDANVYLRDDTREFAKRVLTVVGGDDEVRRRIYGEFSERSGLVYPMFDRSLHTVKLANCGIDDSWCRYIAVDPGVRTAAAVFLAVSPDNSQWVVYDEAYVHEANAPALAREVAKKAQGQAFYAFLIDFKGSSVRDIGSGERVVDMYQNAFRQHGLRSYLTGSGFIPGSTDVKGRIQALARILGEDDPQLPRLRIVQERCPNLISEFSRYQWPPMARNATKPDTRHVHAIICLEYLAAYNPQWHQVTDPEYDEVYRMFLEKQRRKHRFPHVVNLS